MKLLLMICLLLISTAALSGAQGKTVGSRQKAVSRTQPTRASLTRAQTREAERRLSEMGYWTGKVDGVFDALTRSGLIAFQKWEGHAVTGRLTLEEFEAIRAGTSPKPRETGYAHVEVDLDRQVLLIVNDDSDMIRDYGSAASHAGRRDSGDSRGGGVRVLPISSGSGKPFMDEGRESVAHTPRGRFLVYDKVEGWEQGAFRGMYYSNYISGGVAIHGYASVPNQPESHGCIRIPLFAAREVSKLLPIGTIVLVYDKVSFVSGKPWAENPKLKQAIIDWNREVGN